MLAHTSVYTTSAPLTAFMASLSTAAVPTPDAFASAACAGVGLGYGESDDGDPAERLAPGDQNEHQRAVVETVLVAVSRCGSSSRWHRSAGTRMGVCGVVIWADELPGFELMC